MIINNTNYLEQIYECVKNYEDVDKSSNFINNNIMEAFNNRILNVRKHAFNSCTSLISVDFPSATSIGGGAFNNCDSLTSVNLPNATSIGIQAFYSCDALISIDLPNATTIGDSAFRSCTSLTSVNLPNVASIGDYAFRYCDALTSLIVRTNTLCRLDGTYIFDYTPIASGTGYIYVPVALIEQYKKGQYWRTYASQFRALEDYTIDGTTTGELDPDKI